MNDHSPQPWNDNSSAIDPDRTFAGAVSEDIKRRSSPEQTALLEADPIRSDRLAGLHDILANLRQQEERYEREVAVLRALAAEGPDAPDKRVEAVEPQRQRREAFRANVLRRLPDVEAMIAGPEIEPFLSAVPPETSAATVPARLEVALPARSQRRASSSVWAAVFDSARTVPGEFVLVDIPLSRPSVIELASDIRNAHRRSTPKDRLTTLRLDERWDARWGTHDGEHKVWVKFIGNASDSVAGSA